MKKRGKNKAKTKQADKPMRIFRKQGLYTMIMPDDDSADTSKS